VANGTIALAAALQAAGVRFGDEVIVPAYTWDGTATAVLFAGGVPVFADVDPETYCLTAETARKGGPVACVIEIDEPRAEAEESAGAELLIKQPSFLHSGTSCQEPEAGKSLLTTGHWPLPTFLKVATTLTIAERQRLPLSPHAAGACSLSR
jgi:DegT/DnrJ/EryC1/StrS aminotransferase family